MGAPLGGGDGSGLLAAYAERVAGGHREDLPPYWPRALKALVADCWAQVGVRVLACARGGLRPNSVGRRAIPSRARHFGRAPGRGSSVGQRGPCRSTVSQRSPPPRARARAPLSCPNPSAPCRPPAPGAPLQSETQDPARRPSFSRVLERLHAMRREGLGEALDAARPRGNYNPTSDCGCCIM